MTGRKLLEAMSSIDERFIEEAETQSLPRGNTVPWMKWASIAACLCLILTVLGFWQGSNRPGTVTPPLPESMEGLVAPEAPEVECFLPEIERQLTSPLLPPEGGSPQIASVFIRIDQITEDGFIGTVASTTIEYPFELGMELNVIYTPVLYSESVENGQTPTQSMARVYMGAVGDCIGLFIHSYDLESATVYVYDIVPLTNEDPDG